MTGTALTGFGLGTDRTVGTGFAAASLAVGLSKGFARLLPNGLTVIGAVLAGHAGV